MKIRKQDRKDGLQLERLSSWPRPNVAESKT